MAWRRTVLLWVGALLLVAGGLGVTAVWRLRAKPEAAVPIYDVTEFSAVPAHLLQYAEAGSFDMGTRAVTGVAVGPADRIYVCGEHVVSIHERDGRLVREFPVGGPARCLAVGEGGTVFVGVRDHVEVYDETGTQTAGWTDLGEEALLTSMAVARQEVLVADYGHRVVWRFDVEGRMKGCIGRRDARRGVEGFILPSPHFDVALTVEGELWVVNPGLQRVEQYDHDGGFKKAWGEGSMSVEGFCGCCNPTDLAIGPGGRFFTSEKGLVRVKVFNAEGKFDGVVAGPASFSEGTTGLDLAVDSQGRVIVLDPRRRAVRVFVGK